MLRRRGRCISQGESYECYDRGFGGGGFVPDDRLDRHGVS
jgi:hypothetical protein